MRQGKFRLGWCALVVLLGSGCAIADYEKPIKSFSEATDATQKALQSYGEAVTGQVRDARRREGLSTPAAVRIAAGDCLRESKRCRVVVFKSRTDPSPRELSPEFPIPLLVALAASIKEYADGLQAIVVSDSRAKAEASLASVNGTLQNLAKLAGEQGKALEGFAAPVAMTAGWIVGVYIDAVRIAALKRATKNADPLIAKAAEVFAIAAQRADASFRATLGEAVSTRSDEFRTKKDEASMLALIRAAEAYDTVLTSPPGQTLKKFSEAHSALTAALEGPEINLQTAFSQFQTLKAEGEKLAKIISAFIKAAEAKKE